MSDGMRYDFIASPLRITDVSPGLVETEFFDVMKEGKGVKPEEK